MSKLVKVPDEACGLELKSRRQLHHARPSSSQPGVPLCHIRRLCRKAAGTIGQRLLKREPASRGRRDYTAGKCKLRVIENIEEFGAQLQRETLGQIRVFCDREINVPEAWTVDGVAAEITEIASRLREREGIDVAKRGTSVKDRIHPGTISGRWRLAQCALPFIGSALYFFTRAKSTFVVASVTVIDWVVGLPSALQVFNVYVPGGTFLIVKVPS